MATEAVIAVVDRRSEFDLAIGFAVAGIFFLLCAIRMRVGVSMSRSIDNDYPDDKYEHLEVRAARAWMRGAKRSARMQRALVPYVASLGILFLIVAATVALCNSW